MGLTNGAVCLLLTLLYVHGAHEPPSGTPAFVRSAVESPPQIKHLSSLKSSEFSERPTFGDIFLPLRSAVENVPSISPVTFTAASRSFIRDSVEYRPSSNKQEEESSYLDEQMADESHPYAVYVEEPNHTHGSEKYAAFIIPSTYDDRYPQPFRFGSPYQQIVEAPQPIENKQNIKSLLDVDVKPTSRKDLNEHPKVLCYTTNWAFYRKNDGKFAPENLDTSLCTAIIYSFASLDPKTLMIKPFDPWVDIENEIYTRTTSLKIPVLLALGGWTDSTGDKYSKLVSNPTARKAFASNLVGFLNRYGFKGLHLDWNYPKCWQSDCRKGPASDKPNFTKLIQDIREEFDRFDHTMQLGVAISGYKEIITSGYELGALSKVVDYLTVMSYDYHGAWEHQTGHVSPLYGRPNDKYPQYNTDFTMSLLINNGAAKEKIIMGIPFYGQTFTLSNSHNNLVGEGISASGAGEPGEFTKQPGMMAYYEICQRIRKGKWLVGRDGSHKSGPYAMLRNQWVGYEDPASVELKARYAVNNGYGGIAAWTVDLDDFQNRCCSESFPLLKAINRALGRLSSPPPSGTNCQRPSEPVTPIAPLMTTVGESGLPVHEHTTWPSWNPVKPEVTTSIPSWQKPTTTTTSTTTFRPSTQTSSTWWQPDSTTTKPTVWWEPSTTTSTTTLRPTTTTPKRTTPISTISSSFETTTIPAPAIVMPVVIVDGVKCESIQFMRDPNNCNSYYQCVYNAMRQQHCPGGLHWNEETKNCDWPSAAKCEPINRVETTTIMPSTSTNRPITTTTTTTTKRTTSWTSTTRKPTTEVPTKPSTQVPTKPAPPRQTSLKPRPTSAAFSTCENGMYYPHEDCESFSICVNNKLISQHCGADLQWNIQLNSCDWANNVRCISKKNYLRLIHTRSSISDPCEGSSYVPYPGDCSQYLICNWNRLEAAECPPGLHWNQNQQNCDWPSNARCDESSANVPPLNGIDGNNNGISLPSTTWRPSYAPTLSTTSTTRRPTYPTDRPNLQPLSGYYKVVCYFTNWAWYRKGLGRYTPDDINTDLCTHIVYGFAVLDYTELTIRTHDSWADIDNRFYERVTELKKKGVKVSLALGGWNDSQGDKYSRLVRNAASRAKFVKQALQFVEKYGFEGLDLDWEYPVCWQTECNKGFPDEKEGFTALVRELSREFKPRGLLLSTAVSPSKKIIDAGYDVPELAELFDWIAVMTYDFHGQWDKKTGHVAPLFYHPDDDYEYFNANFSINYWIEKGAPSRKIVMGMPLYGQSFSLSDVKTNGLNSHAPGPGRAGEFTRAAGFLAYYEICDRIKNHGWNVVNDVKGRMGPYAYKENQWVSYDDPDTLRRKSQLVRSLNLGGGMVWALDLDDFRNRCGDGVHPLLTTIRDILKDPPSGFEAPPTELESNRPNDDRPSGVHDPEKMPENSDNPEIIPDNIETLPDSESIDVDPNTQVEESEVFMEPAGGTTPMSDDFKVICYFTNWAWYRQSGGKYIPEDIDPNLCTHIVYGFAVLNRDRLEIVPHDSWADLDNKFYERVVEFKKRGIKVTVAIGGWNDSAGDKYSRLVRSAAARARFVKHVTEFILKHGFDGLDLDWEYPVCWQVDCNKGYPDEKEGFSELVRELSEEFKPRGLLLSTAVSPNKKVIDAGYDVPKLSNYFDWIAVMTYDYHGQWDKKTGHVAPMYDTPDDNPTFNANFSINYWLELGADRKKIIMGMPMYGQSFSLAENTRNTLNSPTYGGGEAGEATRARGFLSYYEICHNIRNKGWQVVRDRRGRMGPYAYLRDQWVSFDDPAMIRHKSEYIRAMEIGGAMIWALDLDDFKNDCDCETYPLLKTINRVLRNYPGPHPKCKLEDRAELAPDDKMTENYTSTIKPPSSSTWWPIASTTTTNRPRPDEKPFVPIDNAIESTEMDCKGRNFAPHQNDCNKFYLCQFGTFIVQSCPAGLYWNDGHCDWPQNTNCKYASEEVTTRPPTKPEDDRPMEKPTKKPIESPNKKPTERPKPPQPKPPVVHGDEKFKVVCYFTNWAWYRPGEGKYTPDDIDENLCTHVVYGFAVLNGETLTIKTHDSWADIDNRFYERVTDLRKKGIRVTLAIGGWNDSLGDKYSRLVRNPQARARFIKHVIEFIEKYNFEGLDLDWEYPVCWQVDCQKGKPDEKESFADLVRELSIEFKPRNLLLSAAVSPSKMVIDAGYNVPVLARYFDWIAVMTYDFHGHWDKQTGHVAPLYYVPGDNYDYFNGNFSVNYWIEKGCPPEKLIMGMPLYGQSFSLSDFAERGLNQRTIGPGQAGRFTRAAGFLAYYEICEKVNQGDWTVVRDEQGRIGPYAYQGSQWVSYDDVSEIRRKSQFIKRMGLGGGMVWALDLDDFRGRCGCGKHPLLRTLNQELRGTPGQRASDCT